MPVRTLSLAVVSIAFFASCSSSQHISSGNGTGNNTSASADVPENTTANVEKTSTAKEKPSQVTSGIRTEVK